MESRIPFWVYAALTIFLTVAAILTNGFWYIVIGAVSGGFMVGAIAEHRYGHKDQP